jgi:hypothetical protein
MMDLVHIPSPPQSSRLMCTKCIDQRTRLPFSFLLHGHAHVGGEVLLQPANQGSKAASSSFLYSAKLAEMPGNTPACPHLARWLVRP